MSSTVIINADQDAASRKIARAQLAADLVCSLIVLWELGNIVSHGTMEHRIRWHSRRILSRVRAARFGVTVPLRWATPSTILREAEAITREALHDESNR